MAAAVALAPSTTPARTRRRRKRCPSLLEEGVAPAHGQREGERSSCVLDRPAVLEWFASLSATERAEVLTIKEERWCSRVVALSTVSKRSCGIRRRLSGPPRFQLDVSAHSNGDSSQSSPPSLHGQLWRAIRNIGRRDLSAVPGDWAGCDTACAHSSLDLARATVAHVGSNVKVEEDCCYAVTLSPAYLSDVSRFVVDMDAVSGGRFLLGNQGAVGDPRPWFSRQDACPLGMLVAHGVELQLIDSFKRKQSKESGLSGLWQRQRRLEVSLNNLSGQRRSFIVARSLADGVKKVLQGPRGRLEDALFACGALGGWSPGALPPEERYADLDWVGGRPPDALLRLRAIVRLWDGGERIRGHLLLCPLERVRGVGDLIVQETSMLVEAEAAAAAAAELMGDGRVSPPARRAGHNGRGRAQQKRKKKANRKLKQRAGSEWVESPAPAQDLSASEVSVDDDMLAASYHVTPALAGAEKKGALQGGFTKKERSQKAKTQILMYSILDEIVTAALGMVKENRSTSRPISPSPPLSQSGGSSASLSPDPLGAGLVSPRGVLSHPDRSLSSSPSQMECSSLSLFSGPGPFWWPHPLQSAAAVLSGGAPPAQKAASTQTSPRAVVDCGTCPSPRGGDLLYSLPSALDDSMSNAATEGGEEEEEDWEVQFAEVGSRGTLDDSAVGKGNCTATDSDEPLTLDAGAVRSLQEDNMMLRDVCLRLEAEMASMRNVLAIKSVLTAPAISDSTSTIPLRLPMQQAHGRRPRLRGGDGISQLVIPEHRNVSWEVMSDQGGQAFPPHPISWHMQQPQQQDHRFMPPLAPDGLFYPVPLSYPLHIAGMTMPARAASFGGQVHDSDPGDMGAESEDPQPPAAAEDSGPGGNSKNEVNFDYLTLRQRMWDAFPATALGAPALRSRLCEDMSVFVQQVVEDEARRFESKWVAFHRCRQVVRGLWPRAQVNLYGSFVTGLSLPSSDLDLVIWLPKVRKDAPAVTPGPLEGRNAIKQTWQKELARCLASQVWVGAMQSISHTAVPVIKLTTRRQGGQRKREDYEGVATASAARDRLSPPVSPSWGGSLPAVHVDISFEDQMHNGQASNELLLSLIDEFPALRPLVLVLKQFLKERGLCVSYTGGLTSYAVVLMVARYLQEQATHLDAGSLLLGFLDFYGNTFDPRSTGISVARCCYFSRLSPLPPAPGPRMYYPSDAVARRAYRVSEGGNMALPYQFDPLYIEDPLAAENNVGRNCFRIWQIKRAWSEAHSGLLSAMDAPGNGESLLSVLCSLGGKGGRSSTPVASAAAPPAV